MNLNRLFGIIFFFFLLFFSPSLLMNGCLGNIYWGSFFRLQLVLFRASHSILWNVSWCMMPMPIFLGSHFFSLSLSPIHVLRIESLFSSIKGFGSSPFRKRPPARLCVVHGPAFLCSLQFFFLWVSILMRRWPGWVGDGVRSCVLPKLFVKESWWIIPPSHRGLVFGILIILK